MKIMKKAMACLVSLWFFACSGGGGSNGPANNGNNENPLPNPCGDVGGSAYEYVITDIYVPRSLSEGVGVDYDGNGSVDNKLANLMGALLNESSEFEVNSRLDDAIAQGDLVVLGRILANNFTGDSTVAVSVFEGDFTGSNPADIPAGTGTFVRDAQSANEGTLCGRVYGAGMLQAGPGDVSLSLLVSGTQTLALVLHHARMEGIASADGWQDMVIAGLALPDDLKNSIIPNYVDNVNEEIQKDPQGSQFILDTFDNRCSPDIAGCAGNADCAADGIITAAELMCNSTINTILTPDVTVGGTAYVSFAVRVQAARADITNLE